MILEYGVRNFYSFKEWSTISFRLTQNCPKVISLGEDYTRILGIKGANASGKTNILKTLSFLGDFCTNSFLEKPDEELQVEPFFENTDPIEIYIEFRIDQIDYRYEVKLTRKEIVSETLFRKIERESKIIERQKNDFVVCNNDFKDLRKIKNRSNASFISTSNQYEISSINFIYTFFSSIHANVHRFGLSSSAHDSLDSENMSKLFTLHPDYFDFVKKLVLKYDPDISDIEILSRTRENGELTYFPIFTYSVDAPNSYLTFHAQSSGTRALYLQLARYKYVLKSGGVLVLDEFDNYLHPEILPDLLSLFMNKDLNKANAQIIFSTHNTSILDYLGKYRSYLINKERCESYAYRLDEIPGDILRNDRNISPIYKSGKIGGIPKL